jgi:4-hydroxy-3-polyprenylbenzoate decarboxylase
MTYRSLRECVTDLEKHGHLVRIPHAVDPELEMAEIQRRVYQAEGPALLFEQVKGSPFPAVSNLFGTLTRSRFVFRSTLRAIQRLIELKADPLTIFKAPRQWGAMAMTALHACPKKVMDGPVFAHTTRIDQLPQIRCWPDDGGAFILLPQVYSEDPRCPGVMHSNLGMYRIQLSGNDYAPNREIGLHYQIHRGIGVHHAAALAAGRPLRVSIFVGGPPAHTFAAVMPLPEGLPEVAFAGGLAGRRFRYARREGYVLSAEADFCITGTVTPGETRMEGPFGDHLGYYSLQHAFPFLKVDTVYHRSDAIWPFTVVGRPPQEDTTFGALIHEITGPMVPRSIPGVTALHAVDAAGVHPLLLAIGRERYTPYQERQPREILTVANAILGFGQCSLAKYVMIAAQEDQPQPDVQIVDDFLMHILERVDWRRDLHFQTQTTMDTLDYSGTGLNAGSKVVIAAAGPAKRSLSRSLPPDLSLPEEFRRPVTALPGVMLIEAPAYTDHRSAESGIRRLTDSMRTCRGLEGFPLIVLVDDSEFCRRCLNNFLWVSFTRSNPSHDIYGVDSFMEFKHWGCRGPLVIDARLKPHHAPPLIEDPAVTRRVDALGRAGGCLHGII